jgi:hypothetical protein
VKRFGGRKTLKLGERRKKATHQDTTKNRPNKFNLPRRHCSHATKREDEKEIFLETIVVSSSSPGAVHILSARALLYKKRRRDNLAD